MEKEMTFEKIKNRAVRYFGLENLTTIRIFQLCNALKLTKENIDVVSALLDSLIDADIRRIYDDCECE